jgi:hypothetical protein
MKAHKKLGLQRIVHGPLMQQLMWNIDMQGAKQNYLRSVRISS